MLELNKVLAEVKTLAVEVGKMQLDKIDEQLEVNTKSSNIDVVTNIDILSEEMILKRIKELYPEHNILSEEEGSAELYSDYTWIIDPLDGTSNYVHGYPLFSVSIALKYKNEIVLGVIYAPKFDELFYALKDQGACLNDKKINVSKIDAFDKALLVTGFPYDKTKDDNNNIDLYNHFILQAMGIRRSGSAALDLCSLACGRLDGYWELKLNLWDVAAGSLIVKEAGGEAILIEKCDKINIVAGNSAIVKLILQDIEKMSCDFLP